MVFTQRVAEVLDLGAEARHVRKGGVSDPALHHTEHVAEVLDLGHGRTAILPKRDLRPRPTLLKHQIPILHIMDMSGIFPRIRIRN